MKEKRGNPRIAADLRLHLDSQGEMVEMQVSNVSLGGAYCHSPRDIEPMTKIEVVLELPGDDGPVPVRTEAVVVRSERQVACEGHDTPSYRLALWFQRMHEDHREQLMRFLGDYEH
jgi:hypothetical protein